MKSIWTETSEIKEFPQLKRNISSDVCIIGAGITGITTAYLLNKQGLSVTILDKGKVCSRCYCKHNR